MGKKTTKKSETDAEGRKKMVEAAEELLQTKYADLAGSDVMKCRDEALLEDVRKKMGWDYAPGGQFLFDEVRDSRARANAPEEEKPTRRAPRRRRAPSPSPPPPAKRSTPTPAPAKPAPLADQNTNTSALVVATATAPNEIDQLRALVKQADMARKGEKVVTDGGGRLKAVEMRRVGEAEWRWFESRKDAAAAFRGISTGDVTRLCNKTAGSTLLAKGLEARDVFEGASLSKVKAYERLLRAGGLQFRNGDVSSDEGAWKVSGRGAWEVLGQSPPPTYGAVLERFGEFDESQLRKFTAATAEAEAARVHLTHAATLTGPARAAQREADRQRMAANARAEIETMKAMIAGGYFDADTGDLIVGLRADDRDVTISFLDPNAPMDDGPVMIEVRGQEVELKGGPPFERFALGKGDLILAKGDKPVARLKRPTSNVVTWLSAPFARGTSGHTHGGEGGAWAATITPHQKPGAYVRGHVFDPLAAMELVGFHAVAGTRTAATTYDGDSIDGAGTEEFELHLFGSTDLMPELAAEMDRFSQALMDTSRDEPRLCEGVAASYRRDGQGTGRSPAFLFAQPNRARGIPPRAGRGLAFLRTNDYPIMYEVARRCNWHCVRFELVAYRELVPVRLRLHVDSMAELSISAGGLTSAALATA